MKKLLFIGLAIVLALTIGAGAAFAGGNPPKPNLLVTKIVHLVADGVNSTVNSMNNITNMGAVNTTVTKVTDTLYFQSGDSWVEIEKTEYAGDLVVPYELGVGETLELEHLFEFELPVEARALKNVIEVEIEGTNKVFQADWSKKFKTKEPEAEEPEGGDPEATKGKLNGDTEQIMWRAGMSHCYHVMLGKDASGRLNCQIDGEGNLTGVFNGKVSDADDEYCLSLGGVPLGCGTASKNGKLHIKVGPVEITGWNPVEYTQYELELE